MNTNKEREIVFLRYLDALESGKTDALADCLALAECDPQLEQMLLDYHAQENTMDYKKLIPYPLSNGHKRKRGEQWLSPVAAAILLVLIGFMAGIALVLPHGGNNKASVIPPTAPASGGQVNVPSSDDTCYAEVTNSRNIIYLLQSDWVDYPLQVGISRRFLIVRPVSVYEDVYSILFNNRAAIIATDDVRLIGDCTEDSFPIFAYPN